MDEKEGKDTVLTDLDKILNIIKTKNKVDVNSLASDLKIGKEKIESLARLLEENGLIEIRYSITGKTILNYKEAKQTEPRENKGLSRYGKARIHKAIFPAFIGFLLFIIIPIQFSDILASQPAFSSLLRTQLFDILSGYVHILIFILMVSIAIFAGHKIIKQGQKALPEPKPEKESTKAKMPPENKKEMQTKRKAKKPRKNKKKKNK